MNNKYKKNQNSELILNIYNFIKFFNKNNIVIAGIDPGTRIGFSIFLIQKKLAEINIKKLLVIQKNFAKEFDFLKNDIRIMKINNFIYEILTKYNVNVVILEQAYYSSGRFSYSENLLARYTGSIYTVIQNLGIHIINMNYKSMQKIILDKSTIVKDKTSILEKIFNIYPYEIKKSQYDKLDSIGYVYAFYVLFKKYFQFIIDNNIETK